MSDSFAPVVVKSITVNDQPYSLNAVMHLRSDDRVSRKIAFMTIESYISTGGEWLIHNIFDEDDKQIGYALYLA